MPLMHETVGYHQIATLFVTSFVVREDTTVPFGHIWRPIFRSDITSYAIFTGKRSLLCGPGSSGGIATGYGLDGPGIESQWG